MASKKITPKRKAQKKSGHYPVVRGSELSSSTNTSTTKILRVDRELSKNNNRLYRMARYYQVKLDMRAAGTDTQIDVFAIKDTWAVQKAVQMAYAKFMENTAEERDNLGSNMIGRWQDFRIDDGLPGLVDEAVSVQYDINGAAQLILAGQFDLSTVVDAAGTTRTFTLGTGTGTSYAILQQYDEAGNQSQTPSSTTTLGPYADLESDVDAANTQNLQNHGSLPPYNQNGIAAGTPWVLVDRLSRGSNGEQQLSTGYFTAPLGLVMIRSVSALGDVRFTVKAGDYKGVHAPSMLE